MPAITCVGLRRRLVWKLGARWRLEPLLDEVLRHDVGHPLASACCSLWGLWWRAITAEVRPEHLKNDPCRQADDKQARNGANVVWRRWGPAARALGGLRASLPAALLTFHHCQPCPSA